MADLATLKSRIASEIHRSDLTTSIAYAIADAVAHYQGKRFRFNQARATLSTVAGTEFYDDLDDVGQIDAITATVNGRKYVLDEMNFGDGEWINSTTTQQGQPTRWSWYDNQIRLYPIPDAAYSLTVSYQKKIAAPASDTDSNAWTTEAEPLIRYAAEKRLYRDILMDDAAGMKAEMAETEALRRLTKESNQLASGGLRGSM